jgi:hypothetical protein
MLAGGFGDNRSLWESTAKSRLGPDMEWARTHFYAPRIRNVVRAVKGIYQNTLIIFIDFSEIRVMVKMFTIDH